MTSVVTSPVKTIRSTTTSTPVRITTTRIITQGTVSKTKYTAIPTLVTKTTIQTCSIPPRQPWADPWCTITPTLVSAAAISTNSVAAHAARRRGIVHRVPSDREVRVAERKARLAGAQVDRRDTMASSTTVTETNVRYARHGSGGAEHCWGSQLTSKRCPYSNHFRNQHGCHQLDEGHDDPNAYYDCHDDIHEAVSDYSTGTGDHHSSDAGKDADEVHSPHNDSGDGYEAAHDHDYVHTAPAQSTVVCRAKGGRMVG
ncbi:hypothetical protein LTR53_012479 [Teratosphaeriaceae sp. CCFEE 6253]|nr:hypothetical protein LTR53_012479 [Teratosphaeriaceae sp. CCFEE 6253]